MRSRKNSLLIFSVMAIMLFTIPSTQAIDLYADLTITVDNAGFVSIQGNTNNPELIVENSQEYTSKTQSIWTLNITKNVLFTDLVFTITMPDHAEIKSISSSSSTMISEESGNLIIHGYGSNTPLSILVHYQTKKTAAPDEVFKFDVFSLILISSIIILIICFFIVLFFFDKKEKPVLSSKRNDSEKTELKGLNERQKQITNLLQESDIPLTQTDIQRELNIPKASVSRNIRRLELKGLIEKEQIGMSNIIRLKKQ